MKKIIYKIKKWMLLWVLLLTGIVFLTCSGEWRVYGEPLAKIKNRITQLFFFREQNDGITENGISDGERYMDKEDPLPEEDQNFEDGQPQGNLASREEATTVAGTGTDRNAQEDMTDIPHDKNTPEENPEPEEPVWISVEEDYFENVVFIGDSRTVGLYEYGGLEEKAAFYASKGLTIFKLFETKAAQTEGGNEKQTIEEALKGRQFESIYLMLGINEMGTGTIESFIESYEDAIERLKELQPEAVIYIQSILKVTEERSGQGDYVTNEGIEARNEALAQLADNIRVFYLDINPVVCDGSGGMTPEWTSDGVHLKAQYIPLWKEFLQTHVVQRTQY